MTQFVVCAQIQNKKSFWCKFKHLNDEGQFFISDSRPAHVFPQVLVTMRQCWYRLYKLPAKPA